tara:strand:+ start:1376 stop:1579 length:204 start_codon:yes stop_codon:yes gene_type:complete
MKEYNENIDYQVQRIRAMRTVAKEVTLTEFIEQYPRHDYLSLGSLWYSVNEVEYLDRKDLERFEGTD